MKKVLYITNIEVPYRVRFFNQLAEQCDLTVLYESQGSESRNKVWAKSELSNHCVKYLQCRMDVLGLLKEVFEDYNWVIIGCYNSPVQMVAILVMRLLRRPYMINLDGETFLEGKSLKSRMKRFFLNGANKYLVAGEKAAQSLKAAIDTEKTIPYYFSSLSYADVHDNGHARSNTKRNEEILVVAQYLHCKGNDVALATAKLDNTLHFKFIGMGAGTTRFLEDYGNQIPPNVEVIPFLQKKDLEEEYKKCAMLVLPSRQECWGLVINEAASFGTPIVSTWGSGAAVEFLSDQYPQYLAKPGDAESLYECIQACLHSRDKQTYSAYLQEKSKKYTIEACVQAHLSAINGE